MANNRLFGNRRVNREIANAGCIIGSGFAILLYIGLTIWFFRNAEATSEPSRKQKRDWIIELAEKHGYQVKEFAENLFKTAYTGPHNPSALDDLRIAVKKVLYDNRGGQMLDNRFDIAMVMTCLSMFGVPLAGVGGCIAGYYLMYLLVLGFRLLHFATRNAINLGNQAIHRLWQPNQLNAVVRLQNNHIEETARTNQRPINNKPFSERLADINYQGDLPYRDPITWGIPDDPITFQNSGITYCRKSLLAYFSRLGNPRKIQCFTSTEDITFHKVKNIKTNIALRDIFENFVENEEKLHQENHQQRNQDNETNVEQDAGLNDGLRQRGLA